MVCSCQIATASRILIPSYFQISWMYFEPIFFNDAPTKSISSMASRLRARLNMIVRRLKFVFAARAIVLAISKLTYAFCNFCRSSTQAM